VQGTGPSAPTEYFVLSGKDRQSVGLNCRADDLPSTSFEHQLRIEEVNRDIDEFVRECERERQSVKAAHLAERRAAEAAAAAAAVDSDE
jgi:hypothetical protein